MDRVSLNIRIFTQVTQVLVAWEHVLGYRVLLCFQLVLEFHGSVFDTGSWNEKCSMPFKRVQRFLFPVKERFYYFDYGAMNVLFFLKIIEFSLRQDYQPLDEDLTDETRAKHFARPVPLSMVYGIIRS